MGNPVTTRVSGAKLSFVPMFSKKHRGKKFCEKGQGQRNSTGFTKQNLTKKISYLCFYFYFSKKSYLTKHIYLINQ